MDKQRLPGASSRCEGCQTAQLCKSARSGVVPGSRQFKRGEQEIKARPDCFPPATSQTFAIGQHVACQPNACQCPMSPGAAVSPVSWGSTGFSYWSFRTVENIICSPLLPRAPAWPVAAYGQGNGPPVCSNLVAACPYCPVCGIPTYPVPAPVSQIQLRHMLKIHPNRGTNPPPATTTWPKGSSAPAHAVDEKRRFGCALWGCPCEYQVPLHRSYKPQRLFQIRGVRRASL